jgi:exosortase H (IPTLxxWG-CTERM-specific)
MEENVSKRQPHLRNNRRVNGSARAVSRFLITALALLAILFVTLTRISFFDRHVVAPYTSVLARSTSAVLRVVGISPVAAGTSVSARGFSATIVPACAGIEIMAMLAAVILAFPAPLRYRLAGVIWGLAAVHLINVGRLVALFLIGIHFRSGFDQAHYYYAQGFLLLSTMGVWALWVSRLPRHEFSH